MSIAKHHALLVALGLAPAEPEQTTEEQPPDFDRGAREPAPGPSDPEAEHNEFLLDILRRAGQGGGDW